MNLDPLPVKLTPIAFGTPKNELPKFVLEREERYKRGLDIALGWLDCGAPGRAREAILAALTEEKGS